jgi:hypothetical protein
MECGSKPGTPHDPDCKFIKDQKAEPTGEALELQDARFEVQFALAQTQEIDVVIHNRKLGIYTSIRNSSSGEGFSMFTGEESDQKYRDGEGQHCSTKGLVYMYLHIHHQVDFKCKVMEQMLDAIGMLNTEFAFHVDHNGKVVVE